LRLLAHAVHTDSALNIVEEWAYCVHQPCTVHAKQGVMSHNTLMKFTDKLWLAPSHSSHPCHIHKISAHVPCPMQMTSNPNLVLSLYSKLSCILLCPNSSYVIILCLPFMYTYYELVHCTTQPEFGSSKVFQALASACGLAYLLSHV